jgi:hypothetical protein
MRPIILDMIGVDTDLPILNRVQSKNFDPRFVTIKNSYFINKDMASQTRKDFLPTVCNWNKKGVDGLIFHNLEQHVDPELCQSVEIISKFYNKKIMIVDEPIWGVGRHSERATNAHEYALRMVKPDLVGYSCLYDGLRSPAKSFYWNNMVDKYAIPARINRESEDRENVIYGGGKQKTNRTTLMPYRTRIESWAICREIERRIENLTATLHFSDGSPPIDHPYSRYTQYISKGTYHYQPVCGYHFHNLRSLMAWFCGVIPIIHVPDLECFQWKMHVEYFNIEHGQNCILVNRDDEVFESAIELMKNEKKINEILENIKCMDLSAHSTTAVSKKIWEAIGE